MILTTIIIEQSDTGEVTAMMNPPIGILQLYSTNDKRHGVIWEPPHKTDAGYMEALKKQKEKPKLRRV